jgi:predicted metal-dependent phosphoesterase TrpH
VGISQCVHFNNYLKEEQPVWVKRAQGGEKTHGGTSVSQHVEHTAKFGRLVKRASRVTIKGVQEATEDVTPAGDHVVGRHEPEGQQGEKNTSIAYGE